MKSVSAKFFIFISIFMLLFSFFLLYRSYNISHNYVREMAGQQAEIALEFEIAIRKYIGENVRPLMYELVGEEEFIPEVMSTSFVARRIFEDVQQKFPDFILKFSSDNPRNPINQAGPEELKLIKFFNDNPQKLRWGGEINIAGQKYMARFNARRMEKSCDHCHGEPEDAPESLLIQYGDKAGFHRPDGQVIALDTIAIPISKMKDQLWTDFLNNFAVTGAGLALLIASIFFSVKFFITNRLSIIAHHMTTAADQIEYSRIGPISIKGHDEISALANNFNILANKLHKYYTSLETQIKERTRVNEQLNLEIEERIRTEEELRQAKATLENVFNNSNPLCITNTDFELVTANNAYYDVFGKTPKSESHIKCYDSRPGSLCHNQNCPLTRILQGEKEVVCETSKDYLDGTTREFIVTARPFLDANGTLIGILENFQDITDRKKAENALASEREQLAVTLRSIGDGVITTDIQGNIVLLNKIAEQLTGWNNKEAVGRPLSEIFHIVNETTREFCENPVEKVIKSGEIIELSNTILIDKKGNEKLISDSGAPIRDKNSVIIGVVLVFRDITEKNAMEEELLKIKKLESVGVLAGGIAHDFNNILAAILGNINLALLYIKPEEKIYSLLKDAEKASLRAKSLTQQLLTFSKGGEPVRKIASISEIITDSAEFVLRGSKIKCKYDIPDNLWPVEIDAGQMSQVIQNIIINASNAMPEGGVVDVSCENYLKKESAVTTIRPGQYIKISIKDQGIGIPPQMLDKIFDPYYTTKQKGSGLGLAVTHSIINKHGGYIFVNSIQGEGTTFTIYLPALKHGQVKVGKEDKPLHVSKKCKILIMDDEELVRNTAKEMLSHFGVQVILAKDGEEAIDLYSEYRESAEPIDITIMDLTVPGGMGGKKAMEKLLEIDPKIKAIVSSGYSNDPIMANHKKYGFVGVINKPFLVKELIELINQLI